MQDVHKTIISRYQNSPALKKLIFDFNANVDPTANLDAFWNLIWNVDTAEGIGLDIWGRIVGVGRVLTVATTKYFGFAEATAVSAEPFDSAPFYSGGASTSNVALTDSAFRTLIFAKAYANISDGSIGSINNILMTLFGSSGLCYCTDGGDMTMTYTFKFVLSAVQASIVGTSGILPRPAGVALSIVQGP